jgi:hypothetical protein
MRASAIAAAVAAAISASPAAAASAALNASVVDGTLTWAGGSRVIGSATSSLNGVIAELFAPLAPPAAGAGHAIVNSTSGALSYLILTGAFDADAAIVLPPQLILVLDGATLTANASIAGAPALIVGNGSSFAGVVAPGGPSSGRLVCPPGGPSPAGILAAQSANFVVDGVTVDGCGNDDCASGIHIRGVPYVTGGAVLNSVVTGSCRAIWTETATRVVIHGNAVFNNSMHAIDLDAFSSDSVVSSNSASWNDQEGVFIEQGATNIVVANNTLGPGNAVGIAVYNNDINSTTSGHVIVANRIIGNLFAGISVGSTVPHSGAPDAGVAIVGNVIAGNGAAQPQGVRSNGGQAGTV